MHPSNLPIVAIVGRPNVGKSTLFNRITRRRFAVVHPTPGVTRDRNYAEAEYHRRRFFLVDTGGYEVDTDSTLLMQMREQTLLAVEEADAVIFLADASEPDNPTDDEIIQTLRRSGKPLFLAVNKCDSPAREAQAWSLSRLGFDTIYPISALHGHGVFDLMDDVVSALPKPLPEARNTAGPGDLIRVAIVGRQNVGKSTLLNRLLGRDRVIANEMPGTTRDAIDTYIEREGRSYCLIDTAGIRRRGRIERGIEHLCVLSSVLALRRCDVAILVLDVPRGIHQQDTHIAGFIQEEGKPCIIVLNKWDVVEKDTNTFGSYVKQVREEFNFLPHALILSVSALTGQRCHRIWELIDHCNVQAHREIQTSELNRVLQAAVQKVSPPVFHGRLLKIKYAAQTGVAPPTFTLFVNDPNLVHFSYKRYLLNRLRDAFGMEGAPIRIFFRRKSPPEGWDAVMSEIERAPRIAGERRQTPSILRDDVVMVETGDDEIMTEDTGQDLQDEKDEGQYEDDEE